MEGKSSAAATFGKNVESAYRVDASIMRAVIQDGGLVFVSQDGTFS